MLSAYSLAQLKSFTEGKMTLTLRINPKKIFEIYDLDKPNSTPVQTCTERWKAIEYMRRHELTTQ